MRSSTQDSTRYVEAVISGSEPGSCSVVTEAEIWTGIRHSQERIEAAALISKFEIIPLNSEIARLAGSLLNGKSQGEIRAHFGDALIAATAIQHGEPILTADQASQRVFGTSIEYIVYR